MKEVWIIRETSAYYALIAIPKYIEESIGISNDILAQEDGFSSSKEKTILVRFPPRYYHEQETSVKMLLLWQNWVPNL